jgi:hypothetical protein
MCLVEAAMEREDADSVGVFVLDETIPRHATTSATLNVCRA